jgi:hypothetical protein
VSSIDYEYDPYIIAAVLNNWPRISEARRSGVLRLNIVPESGATIENKIAIEKIGAMAPVAKRSQGTVYRIDDAAAILCDIDLAMKAVLTRPEWRILVNKFFYGYEEWEIADAIGSTEAAVKARIQASITAMATWLETPKPAKSNQSMTPRSDSHKRKYASFPR